MYIIHSTYIVVLTLLYPLTPLKCMWSVIRKRAILTDDKPMDYLNNNKVPIIFYPACLP